MLLKQTSKVWISAMPLPHAGTEDNDDFEIHLL